MKIALIGYGKMGKAIEQIALQRGHSIHAKIDRVEELEKALGADCCIEFTQPNAAYANLNFCAQNNLPTICGTTAWYDNYEAIKSAFLANNGALVTATNFSIGVNLFFKFNAMLADIMSKFKEYKPSMEEIHHLQKLDHPSGTATTLAEGILDNNANYKSFSAYLEGEKVSLIPENISILCKREPEVPGTHTIKYNSEIDEIAITHTAKNRTGFATGAVLAAEWLQGKNGVYKMNDVLGI